MPSLRVLVSRIPAKGLSSAFELNDEAPPDRAGPYVLGRIMRRHFRQDVKGFTLIELLIVVAIVGVAFGGLRGFSTQGGEIPHFLGEGGGSSEEGN